MRGSLIALLVTAPALTAALRSPPPGGAATVSALGPQRTAIILANAPGAGPHPYGANQASVVQPI